MDALTFIAELAKALAWPAATVVLVTMLRGEIRSLLPFLKKLKAGPVEAEFEREVKELKVTSEAEPQLLPPPQQEVPPEVRQSLLELAQRSPRAAILEAWLKVEEAGIRVVQEKALYVPERQARSPLAVIRALNKENLLDHAQVALYHDLRALRNQAVHVPDFSPPPEAVLDYIELADRLRRTLDQVATQR